MQKIRSSEITPEQVYLNRRAFIKAAGISTLGAFLAACGGAKDQTVSSDTEQDSSFQTQAQADELGDPLNTFQQITNYNNYYEFSITKEEVADAAKNLVTSPWQVQVGGLVSNPKT